MVSLFTGVLGMAVSCLIIWLVRKDHLHVNHGFGWIVVAVGFGLLGFIPGFFDWVATHLGIAYPPILALTIAVTVLVLKILLMDIERSKLEMTNQRLTQRLAILEADVDQLRPRAKDTKVQK